MAAAAGPWLRLRLRRAQGLRLKLATWALSRWPMTWRSGLPWALLALPGLLALAWAMAAGQELKLWTLPDGDWPTTTGEVFIALMLALFVAQVLLPRQRFPLGAVGWPVLVRSWLLAGLGTWVLVLPLCLYDGVFSARVAALASQADLDAARTVLTRLGSLVCGPAAVTARASEQSFSRWQDEIERERAALEPVLARMGLPTLRLATDQSCGSYLTLPVQFTQAQGPVWVSAGTLLAGLDRAAFERLRGEGGVGEFGHGAVAAARSFLFRQTGCLAFVLWGVVMDLLARPRRRAGTEVGARWVHAFAARWAAWHPGHRQGAGAVAGHGGGAALANPRRGHSSFFWGAWAARAGPVAVAAGLTLAAVWLGWVLPEKSSDLPALLVLLAPASAIGAAWYWHPRARGVRLNALDAAAWRGLAAAAAAALLPLVILTLHASAITQLSHPGSAALVVALMALLLAHLWTFALLAQAGAPAWAPGVLVWLLVGWVLCLASWSGVAAAGAGLGLVACAGFVWLHSARWPASRAARGLLWALASAALLWSPILLMWAAMFIADALAQGPGAWAVHPDDAPETLQFLWWTLVLCPVLAALLYGWALLPAMRVLSTHHARPRR